MLFFTAWPWCFHQGFHSDRLTFSLQMHCCAVLLPNFLRSEDLIIIKESSGLHFCSAVAEFSNLPATTQRFWLSLFDLEGSSDLSVVPAWQVSAPVEQLWYHTTICFRCQQLFLKSFLIDIQFCVRFFGGDWDYNRENSRLQPLDLVLFQDLV